MSSVNANLRPGEMIPILVGEDDQTPPPPPPNQQIVISNITNPKVFHGRQEEDVEDWIDQYKTAKESNGWDDPKAITRMKLSLDGSAKAWYKSKYAAAPPANLEAFYTALRAAFGRFKPDLFNRQRMSSRRQHLGESPVSYAYDKLELCAKLNANMSEEEKITHVIQGLDPVYSQAVYHKHFDTTAELVTALKGKYEAKLHAGTDTEVFVAQPAPDDAYQRQRQYRMWNKLCYKCGAADHMMGQCPRNQPRPRRTEQATPPAAP